MGERSCRAPQLVSEKTDDNQCLQTQSPEHFPLNHISVDSRESPCNAGDPGFQTQIPGSGRYPGERNGNLL